MLQSLTETTPSPSKQTTLFRSVTVLKRSLIEFWTRITMKLGCFVKWKSSMDNLPREDAMVKWRPWLPATRPINKRQQIVHFINRLSTQNPCASAASTQYFLPIQRQQDSVKDLSAMLWIRVILQTRLKFHLQSLGRQCPQMSFIESRLRLR